jgi:uncharacterized membrane protein
VEVATWQGPIPPPATLEGYRTVIENGPERIFKQFEAETQHRHRLERRTQTFPLLVQLTAYACALVFALGVLGVTLFAIAQKAYWVAGLFGTGVLGVVVTAFVRYGLPHTKTK